jgi:hypothetical protein
MYHTPETFLNVILQIGNQISLVELQQKIKKTVTEEKIQLTYKPLKEIRHNLVRLQVKWLQPLKNNSMEKQQ